MVIKDLRIKIIFGSLVGLLLLNPAYADTSVSVSVPNTQAGPNEGVRYQIEIQSSESISGDLEVVFPHAFKEQGIVPSGPSVSSGYSMQLFGGKSENSYQKTYTYALQFPKSGQFTLQNVEVRLKGKRYPLDSVTVEIDEKYAGQRRRRRGGGILGNLFGSGSFDSFFSPFRRGPIRPPTESDIELSIQLSSNQVVTGEPIFGKLIAYIHNGFRTTQLSPHVDFSSDSLFWIESIRDKVRMLRQVGQGNDVAYLIDEFVLFPLRAGQETIDQVSLGVHLIAGMRTFPFDVKAGSQSVSVAPLPDPKPRIPLTGEGLVATLDLEKQTSVVVNEPLPLFYSVEGAANLRLVKSIPLKPQPDAELILKSDEFTYLRRQKKFRLTKGGYVIFRKPGHYTLNLEPLQYYSPEKEAYMSTDAQVLTVEVMPASVRPPPDNGVAQATQTPSASMGWRINDWVLIAMVGGLGLLFGLVCIGLWRRRNRPSSIEEPRQENAESTTLLKGTMRLVLERVQGGRAEEILGALDHCGLLAKAENLNNPDYISLIERYHKKRFSGAEINFSLSENDLANTLVRTLLKDVAE